MPRTINYTDETSLAAFLTNRDLVDCLDDDGDEVADAEIVTACIEAACDEIDAAFDMRGIVTPLDTAVEKSAPHWAKYLFVAHAYARRMKAPEKSAHGEMIKTIRQLLAKIGTGSAPVASLKPGSAGTTGSNGVAVPGDGNVVDVVSEESLTVPTRNRVLS